MDNVHGAKGKERRVKEGRDGGEDGKEAETVGESCIVQRSGLGLLLARTSSAHKPKPPSSPPAVDDDERALQGVSRVCAAVVLAATDVCW